MRDATVPAHDVPAHDVRRTGPPPGGEPGTVVVRERADADVGACADLLEAVHRADGYPRVLTRTPVDFLLARHEIGAWVATLGSAVVGHVALHEAARDPVLASASAATGLSSDELAVVARLLVSPSHRRRGLGRTLLDLAVRQARARGLRAVLDVVDDAAGAPAAALYAAAGWTAVADTTFRFGNGATLAVRVWLSPGLRPGG